MKHKQADLMLQYAKDVANTNKPWVLWEYFDPTFESEYWISCTNQPAWNIGRMYRRKPIQKFIRIGDMLVPEPMRSAPELGTECWAIQMCEMKPFPMHWDEEIIPWLINGLLHKTEEAAQTHLDAILKLNMQPGFEK